MQMSIAEIIKHAREGLGMTQEDLAEKLEVSRQAVSKWELGASVPSPENLGILEEVLGVSFPPPEEAAALPEQEPGATGKAPFWNWKRVVLLVLGILVVLALLANVMFMLLVGDVRTDAPRPTDSRITGIYFFNADAAPLQPDLGDRWNSFTAGERVLVLVTFEDGTENTVSAVSLFLTPTGTGTLEYREQIAVQAAGEGRDFALFAWDIPQEGLMGHLEVVLECSGNLRVTETQNATAPPFPVPVEVPGILAIAPAEIHTTEGDIGQYVLEVYGVPFAEVEWTSSDPRVARVANTGRTFIEGPGEAIITASWKNQTAECLVQVEAAGTEENTDLEAQPESLPEAEARLPQYEPRVKE